MGRHAGDDAVERLVCEQRDLAAEQHARIDAADRREADKAAVQHLGHEKADLVEMRVEQHGLCVLRPQDLKPSILPFLSTSTVSQYGRNSSATASAACAS